MFRYITLPSIRPALVVVLTTIGIGTLKVFDIVRTMTGGQFDTSVVANEFYNQSFRYNAGGLGAALAVLLFVLVIPIVIYNIRPDAQGGLSREHPRAHRDAGGPSETEHAAEAPRRSRAQVGAGDAARAVSSPWASLAAIVIAVLWTMPTLGLLVTSFRAQRDINTTGWWTVVRRPGAYTLENYRQVLAPGTSASLAQYLINTIVITIPAVMMPIFLASLAAYAFAWMPFPGRDALFVAVFALQIVPLQVALIPLLDMYVEHLGFGASYGRVWLSHTIFALPLATFLIHNFMRELPGELMEAARVDGAGHVTIFFKIMLPLLTPALAAFGIFQFLWVWNDLLVSLVFLGGTPDVAPITVRVAALSGPEARPGTCCPPVRSSR